MTRQEAHRLFERLRAQFAAHRPELRTLRLVLRKRHFLRRPAPRDLAWYETSDGTVNLMEAALAGPAGRVEGLLAHELGHALDADATRPYAERRADALAKRVLGVPVRYDDGDVQNLHRGVTPRPARLHENRESEMKRNPTTAYHRARGDAELFLAEDAYKKAQAMSRRGDAKGAHDSYIHAHRMAALAESDLLDGASAKAAQAKGLTWWKAYSQLAQSTKRRNPAKGYKMPETQARHTAEGLLARMKADGADTFAKKVAWVKRHIPSIDRPRTFVGWVTKGERGRVVYKKRNPLAGPYPEKVDWDDADSFEAHIVLDDGQVVTAGKLKHPTVDSALAAVNGLLKFGGQISPYRVKTIEISAYRGNDYLGSQRWVQEDKKRNPSRNPSFSKWLDTFLEEKEIDMEEVLTVKGKAWGTNYIPVGVVVRAMKMAPKHEQDAIKTMLVKIDFANAPVRPYLAHLAQAIAR